MGKLTCAIADDNERMLQLLEDVLHTDEEIQVVGKAHNGEEILNVIKEKEPDVVLLDIIMPKLDGLTVMEKARYCHNKEAGFHRNYSGRTGRNNRGCIQSWRILLHYEAI